MAEIKRTHLTLESESEKGFKIEVIRWEEYFSVSIHSGHFFFIFKITLQMSLGSLLLLWKQWETIAQGAKGVTMGIKREVQSEFFFLLEFILRDFFVQCI